MCICLPISLYYYTIIKVMRKTLIFELLPGFILIGKSFMHKRFVFIYIYKKIRMCTCYLLIFIKKFIGRRNIMITLICGI